MIPLTFRFLENNREAVGGLCKVPAPSPIEKKNDFKIGGVY